MNTTKFEINVSKNGTHVFATHERSIFNVDDLIEKYGVLVAAFPKSKGYSVDVTYTYPRTVQVNMSSREQIEVAMDRATGYTNY